VRWQLADSEKILAYGFLFKKGDVTNQILGEVNHPYVYHTPREIWLFRVEIRGHTAMLVPAGMQYTRPAPRLSRTSLSAFLPNDLADQVRDAALKSSVSVSSIITSAVAEFLGVSAGNVILSVV
jgi:hypothetical protein